MPRYQAISQSHMTPRRRRRMKWAYLNTQQECRINENTKNDPGSVFAYIPVKSILEVTEASDNTFAVNIPILTSDNAEGIINTSNRFEDQVGNPFFDESIESSDINNTIYQFSRSVDLEEHKTSLISDLRVNIIYQIYHYKLGSQKHKEKRFELAERGKRTLEDIGFINLPRKNDEENNIASCSNSSTSNDTSEISSLTQEQASVQVQEEVIQDVHSMLLSVTETDVKKNLIYFDVGTLKSAPSSEEIEQAVKQGSEPMPLILPPDIHGTHMCLTLV
ncbi:hypothetical protein JTB14_002423 [Gonioctena quinquepunctata]|nr:hypothetical protein JTB14_002423 [Gonioctena quinquepunctata]